ncbi:hypothetical protein Glove_13g19 [Diversispora epigaea]|uniref:Uncharacterized protein n=1 Tax=Diversispora epigaea TaxID=1348612 RepID=A0A397JQ74_9GLOM|nr:hypothetical protein Glove_13g19 [Diversispora epigaea]
MTLNFYENLSNDYVKLLENGDEHKKRMENLKVNRPCYYAMQCCHCTDPILCQ